MCVFGESFVLLWVFGGGGRGNLCFLVLLQLYWYCEEYFGCRLLFYFGSIYLVWEGLLHHKNRILLLTIFLCLIMISNQVFQYLGYHLWLINRSQGTIRAVVTICSSSSSSDLVCYLHFIEGPSWSWRYGSFDLQLPVQSVPITTKVVSSNPLHGEVYLIQHYMIKFVSD